jgi:hypothetical protein
VTLKKNPIDIAQALQSRNYDVIFIHEECLELLMPFLIKMLMGQYRNIPFFLITDDHDSEYNIALAWDLGFIGMMIKSQLSKHEYFSIVNYAREIKMMIENYEALCGNQHVVMAIEIPKFDYRPIEYCFMNSPFPNENEIHDIGNKRKRKQ